MLLEVKNIHSYYRRAHILHGISMEVDQGEIVCLLGRNGVGKTTTLKSIAGLVPPKSGSILFKRQEMAGQPPYRITRLGMGYVPEERRIFAPLTVQENLLVGIKVPQREEKDPWTIDRIYQLYPEIRERANQKGGTLSGGEQQILTIARTLMGNPDLILVDEPSEGLAPLLVERVFQMLREIQKSGTSILLVDNAFSEVLGLAKRVYVISKGEVVFQGSAENLMATEDVKNKYITV